MIDNAVDKVTQAKICVNKNQLAQKEFLLRNTSTIIDTLRNCLNISSNQIVEEIDQFYDDVCEALQIAGKAKNINLLDYIIKALTEIKGIWKNLLNNKQQKIIRNNYTPETFLLAA